MQKLLIKLETYAHTNSIPIMQKDGIEFLCDFIKEKKIKSILEIGSAIGYSAIKMCLIDKKIKVTTIERDKERYEIALKNFKNFNLEKRTTIFNIDALNYIDNNKYDLIFIDAAKSSNINFFKKFSKNLNENGYIITDNLSFHGLVENNNLIKTKNQRALVRKIKDYLKFLSENIEYRTNFYEVGDRISISTKI